SDPPAELKAKFNALKNVEESTTANGLTRYTVGSFHDYSSAQKLKEELHKQGIDGAFVIAFFKNELISVPEAIELLRH
ncbi:MAG TPA: SPOR domain-containing protein, partial [Bacteroidia bacterium]|nr:SPOR domain-containing protein [Bacteroidia bacterium]